MVVRSAVTDPDSMGQHT